MKKLLFVFLSLLVCIKAIIFMNQKDIMTPEKRELQPYHLEWLENPNKHNIKIEKYFTKSKIPYMIVTQDTTKGLSKRQKVLSEQLGNTQFEKSEKTLVLLHGKNGRKEDLLPVAERYVLLGFRCILIDLPHHGESQMKHLHYTTKAYEKNYVDEVLEDSNLNTNQLYIWGMSLGGAFAIANVSNSKYDFQAMVLVATFDNLQTVLSEKSKAVFGEVFGAFLYQGLEKSLDLLYNFQPSKVDSGKLAQSLTLPLYMTHGKKDELIPYQEGKKLFDKFASKAKKFHLDEEGDHHNILTTKHEFYKESGLFLLGVKR
jgi:alpha-beta hydrolase superfamily lysophospholipase